jgi:hypothetical protein
MSKCGVDNIDIMDCKNALIYAIVDFRVVELEIVFLLQGARGLVVLMRRLAQFKAT